MKTIDEAIGEENLLKVFVGKGIVFHEGFDSIVPASEWSNESIINKIQEYNNDLSGDNLSQCAE